MEGRGQYKQIQFKNEIHSKTLIPKGSK
jgi:hypothetical protein